MPNIQIDDQFKELVKLAATEWRLVNQPTVLKSLDQGMSSAKVYCVHIDAPPGVSFPSGEYILKLHEPHAITEDFPTERQLHVEAEARSGAFTEKHIPKLVKDIEFGGQIAMLYDLAGNGLSTISSPYSLNTGMLAEQCRVISREMLEGFNPQVSFEPGITARSTLDQLMRQHLDPLRAPRLHRFVSDECGTQTTRLVGGNLFINALWFCGANFILNDRDGVRIQGRLHGDFHPLNILLRRDRPDSCDFYVIDFALSSLGPIGYDHAYLELAFILHYLDHFRPERIVALLTALDAVPNSLAASQVAPEDFGTLQVCKAIRDEIRGWQRKHLSKSHDSTDAQVLLTRVAAGLNWTNKHLDDSQRRLAFMYACYSATHYLERYYPDVWVEIQAEAAARLKSGLPAQAPESRETWSKLRHALAGFDHNLGKYVLVTARPANPASLGSLGMLPWSLVIDLDPESDHGGCFEFVSPVLARNRSVQSFGKDATAVDFGVGTAWMMAGGWNSHDEAVIGEQEWRWTYPGCIRSICESLQSWRPLVPAYVIVLADDSLTERSKRVLAEIDSAFREHGRILVIGTSDLTTDVTHQLFPMTSVQFAESIESLYGASTEIRTFLIPGKVGTISIPVEDLRHIEEDLEILHSRITEEPQSAASDQFWRGNPPTWGDLASGQVVDRDILPNLQKAIDDAAEVNKTQTITIYHSPGAGGTTLALRVAWDNRNSLPTVVLRRYSRYTSDRLDSLYHRSEKHILLIADASVLPEPDREQLFSELADRHARVIILHVQRTMRKVEHPLTLPDPMDQKEAGRFAKVFIPKATEHQRQRDLHQISTSTDPKWSVYRLPFFFGLIAFQESYLGVEHYTLECLRNASYKIKKALKFLALVTNFSQTGIEEECILEILGGTIQPGQPLEDAFGEGPAHLVIRQEQMIRVIHPTVARQILRSVIGGDDWQAGLKDASVELIREMRKLLGPDPASTKGFMESLFIRRYELGETDHGQSSTRTFSPLILDIGRHGTPEGEQEVFEALTQAYGRNSHYWHHRARHIIYRVRRDFETALDCAGRAIALDSGEMVHYHNKGQVLRYWARDVMSQMLSASPTPTDLLSAIREKTDGAFEAFAIAHTKSPDSRYPHISRIQLIIEVSERLIQAAARSNPEANATVTLQELIRAGGPVAEWLETNIVVAEDDLESVRHMRADNDANYIEKKTEADLSRLYGDFDNMISVWESLLGSKNDSAAVRRNLANAFYGRTKRQWDSMHAEELERVRDLMDENLAADPANGHDIRIWFQAARRLPSFSFNTALDRLTKWLRNGETAEAHFCLYILHFLMWQRSRSTIGEEAILFHIKRCKELALYRRDYCYEWLAAAPAWCPLVDHASLGKMEPTPKGARRTTLFKDSTRLGRVSGTTVPGFERQAGSLKLGGRLTAFFVPGDNLYAYKDQQREVNFFLGFSHEGFRAWDAQPGLAGIQKDTRNAASEEKLAPHKALAAAVSSPTIPKPEKVSMAQFRDLAQQKLLEIVERAPGGRMRISDLGQELERAFPRIHEKVPSKAGFGNLTQMVMANGKMQIVADTVLVIVKR